MDILVADGGVSYKVALLGTTPIIDNGERLDCYFVQETNRSRIIDGLARLAS